MEIDVKAIIKKAVMCDKKGRLLEAQCLYKEGTEMLLEIVEQEDEIYKKKELYDRITQYQSRYKLIDMCLQKQMARGDKVSNINIVEDSIGNSYQSLFEPYLNNDLKEVIIEEPQLISGDHFQNLIIFLETLLKSCKNLKYVRIITRPNPNGGAKQISLLEDVKNEMLDRSVTCHVKIDDSLHSPRIVLSNGFIIKLSRGLHIYREPQVRFPIGLGDYDFRQCLATELDIWRTQSKN